MKLKIVAKTALQDQKCFIGNETQSVPHLERLCVRKTGFEVMRWRGDPPVPGCAGETWNKVSHLRKHALGRGGGRSKEETFPRHSIGPPGEPSFTEPCGGGLDQESPPGGCLYAPPLWPFSTSQSICPALGQDRDHHPCSVQTCYAICNSYDV